MSDTTTKLTWTLAEPGAWIAGGDGHVFEVTRGTYDRINRRHRFEAYHREPGDAVTRIAVSSIDEGKDRCEQLLAEYEDRHDD